MKTKVAASKLNHTMTPPTQPNIIAQAETFAAKLRIQVSDRMHTMNLFSEDADHWLPADFCEQLSGPTFRVFLEYGSNRRADANEFHPKLAVFKRSIKTRVLFSRVYSLSHCQNILSYAYIGNFSRYHATIFKTRLEKIWTFLHYMAPTLLSNSDSKGEISCYKKLYHDSKNRFRHRSRTLRVPPGSRLSTLSIQITSSKLTPWHSNTYTRGSNRLSRNMDLALTRYHLLHGIDCMAMIQWPGS